MVLESILIFTLVLEIEPEALYMLGLSTELCPQPLECSQHLNKHNPVVQLS